ncbi:MAG TPA: hypothetical protein VLQ91_15040 [Draconibacterium sp.]|nr:hypothetical protein [Draconibacterium sp.]
MKTKNNIKKTVLHTVATTTGLAILSLTVNAQVTFKSLFETEGINHFAMATENANISFASNTHNRNFTSAETFAAYLVNETEEPLNVEDWMTNESAFDGFSASLETETETELELEDWMMNENNLTAALKIETETENPLEVEDWMTDESNFNSFSALLKTETESELVLEDWMTNEKIFNNNQNETKVTKNESEPISTTTYFYREVNIEEKLEVESWMLNSNNWGK